MQLSRLTIGDMVPLSQSYLDPLDPAYQALAGVSGMASLMSRLGEAHAVMQASQSSDDLRASSLQRQVTALDAEHDDLVNGLQYLFQALVLLAEDDTTRARWERLRQLLLPEGRKVAQLSYEAEASNAALLEQILDGLPAADRVLLKAQMVGGRSLMTIIESWTATAKELGQKDQERRAVPITPTDNALQSARNQWVRIVGAMVAMLQMNELLGELPAGIKQHVLDPLRIATERVAVRRDAPPLSASPPSTISQPRATAPSTSSQPRGPAPSTTSQPAKPEDPAV